jgi:uncharacterized phage-associated protein
MYSRSNIEKIGNTIIYLSNNIGDLSKTKLLKILYLLDQFSIQKYGLPFLNLKYEVWKLGPVAKEIYIDLTNDDGPTFLDEFINIIVLEGHKRYITPKKEFSDDEFSDNEIELLEKLTQTVRAETANSLIEFTHKKGSLWHNTATRNSLFDLFDFGIASSSIELNFEELLHEDPLKLSMYKHHLALETSLENLMHS